VWLLLIIRINAEIIAPIIFHNYYLRFLPEKGIYEISVGLCYRFQILKYMIDFHETWHERYNALGHFNVAFLIIYNRYKNMAYVQNCKVG
jgi:hypothetical protein